MFVKVNSDRPNFTKAATAWGEPMPEWIGILADACDRATQAAVGQALEKSSGYVSRIINRSYAGSYEEAEQLVRSRLAADQVICPVWQETIPLTACMRNRRCKGTPRTQAHQLYARACPSCPHNLDRAEPGQ